MVIAMRELAARARRKGADTVHLNQNEKRDGVMTVAGPGYICNGK